MKRILIILIAFSSFTVNSRAQVTRPHILVNDRDRAAIDEKIREQAWAKSIWSGMSEEVTPYVERHVADPEWILSRYQMNRVPGKRYTKVFSDAGGLKVTRYEGDAPVPTVRVGSHIRVPVTASGASYRRPALEEIVPYDTSRLMYLYNSETKQKEWIDPQSFTGDINSRINQLALQSAIVYWMKGDEKYAKFAADILDQWVKGAYYMEPIIGPCRTGFLNMQTLGESQYSGLILAYDFLHDYMQGKGYDLSYYESVFEKIASTLAFRGFWNNNWYAAESSTFVYACLSLENPVKREYYLQYYLSKDTINGACGQLALPSTVEKWLTPDGHWKEPGGYHNFPVSNLLTAAMALEKNGYDVFRKFPAMFRASYAMLKYSFPDLTVSAFGDTGRALQDARSLETGILGAITYNQPELPEMIASLTKLISGGRYERENSGYIGLLCFPGELPVVKSSYSWPRSGTLDFAKFFLQRNGMDPVNGLMYSVQGASYNHNHCNGMAMELYGRGTVLGIDAGKGPTYEHPLHVNYYSQWAAHNTVVAEGSSGSVPVSGSAGRKNIGEIALAAMEPMPGRNAVSPVFSFTDTRYYEQSTGTKQSRTLALIRTSDTSGYYVDIYRSDNPSRNDYVYHNLGDELIFLNERREPVSTSPAEYPLVGKDIPGFRFYSDVRKVEKWNSSLIAVFRGKNAKSEPVNMQLLIPAKENRTYYQARSLKAETAAWNYSDDKLPVFTMIDNAESESNPFIVVFEPYSGEKGYSVERINVEKRKDGKEFTALKVTGKNNSGQIIYQSVSPAKTFTAAGGSITGYFGVADIKNNKLSSLYLGKGKEISFGGYSIQSDVDSGSANLQIKGKELIINSNQPVKITLPFRYKKLYLMESGKQLTVPVNKTRGGIFFTIPEVHNGVISEQPQEQGWEASALLAKKLSAERPEINYYEENVPSYTLPDPLAGKNGKPISTAGWDSRRNEIIDLFRSEVFGRVPSTRYKETFRIVNTDENAMGGAATLRQVEVEISREDRSLVIHLSLFTPNKVKKPVPAFLLINNRAKTNTDPTRNQKSEFWPAEEVIARGYAIAAFNNSDVDPDSFDDFKNGIHGLLDENRDGESWGTISAWAWGASRCLDYLVTDNKIDPAKVAVVGHSRGGKTALWAGAEDTRFGMVISNESGCTGAAIARRCYGETIERINKSFPHWFCTNYRKYSGNENALPVDMHMLLALSAPRPLYVACASDDLWGDPKGSYISLCNAVPVFNFLGKKSSISSVMPPLNSQVISGNVGFHVRDGGHNLLLKDWNRFMDFADRVWK
jgi:hypothetical protein